MRRNTVTILKYLGVVSVFLIMGPILLKSLLQDDGGYEDDVFEQVPRGNPKIAEVVKRAVVNRNDKTTKIDWHDYKKIAEEQARVGPGEQGAAVILSAEEEKLKDELYKANGFNGYVSDKISLDRALKDIRHPDCKKKTYLANLPNASIVIPFHGEHWSTLLRSAHSILNRSPPHLIHEIILVDDYSSKEFLKQKLTDHLASHYNGKVKVVRAERREGLIRTRLLGAKHATGEVIIFLDSHIEASINWLPPLLEPIAMDYRTVVCPFIDVIDHETFAYRAQDEGARGAFDWEFFYKRLPLLPEDLKHPAEPFKSPVMAGGLFAISAKWFWELGGYDPGLDIWGGEQYELSFKLWQCGGQMLDAPCSRVGHIYRKFAPFPNPGVGDFVGRNYRRVAEVWMDEYKEFLYLRRPHYRSIDTLDISPQLAIREKLKCKPFKWFMTEVAFDLEKHYPSVEPPNFGEGELRNLGNNLCVDTHFRDQNQGFGLEKCVSDGGTGEQQLALSWHKDLRPLKRTVCFDVSQSVAKAPVILWGCHGMKGNQYFKFNPETEQILHPISNQCLDSDGAAKEIFMMSCDKNSQSQKWKFSKMNHTAIRVEWDTGSLRR